jgi:putative endonuclease
MRARRRSVRGARVIGSGVPFVYLLRCRDDSLYAGAAKNLADRVRAHQRGRASRYTRSRLPVELAWSCEVGTWSEALREECRIKRLRRREKQALVAAGTRRRRARRKKKRSLPGA